MDITQFIINILMGLVALFGGLYIKNISTQLKELKQRDHELTADITQIRLTYVTKQELREMLMDLLAPLSKAIDELKADIKQKKDKDS